MYHCWPHYLRSVLVLLHPHRSRRILYGLSDWATCWPPQSVRQHKVYKPCVYVYALPRFRGLAAYQAVGVKDLAFTMALHGTLSMWYRLVSLFQTYRSILPQYTVALCLGMPGDHLDCVSPMQWHYRDSFPYQTFKCPRAECPSPSFDYYKKHPIARTCKHFYYSMKTNSYVVLILYQSDRVFVSTEYLSYRHTISSSNSGLIYYICASLPYICFVYHLVLYVVVV